MSIIIIVFFLILLILFLIKPNSKRVNEFKVYEDRFVAHRGLYNNTDTPENTLSAFKKAVINGYGIELDIQMTTDEKLVVFHDRSLKRMTGIDKDLTTCSYDELQEYQLLNTDEKIPLFKDVLDLLNEDTPLIIEIKGDGNFIEATKKTVAMMKTYKRTYCMESFHPFVVKWLKDHNPEILRGQLSMNYFKYDGYPNPLSNIVLSSLFLNFLTKPDFIAYDINSNNIFYNLLKKIYKCEHVVYTIKNQEMLNKAKKLGYKVYIFEKFVPKKPE